MLGRKWDVVRRSNAVIESFAERQYKPEPQSRSFLQESAAPWTAQNAPFQYKVVSRAPTPRRPVPGTSRARLVSALSLATLLAPNEHRGGMNQSIDIAASAIASPSAPLKATLQGASEDARKAIEDARKALGVGPTPHPILSDPSAGDAKLQVGELDGSCALAVCVRRGAWTGPVGRSEPPRIAGRAVLGGRRASCWGSTGCRLVLARAVGQAEAGDLARVMLTSPERLVRQLRPFWDRRAQSG